MNSSRFLVGITMTSGTFDHRSGTRMLRNDKHTSWLRSFAQVTKHTHSFWSVCACRQACKQACIEYIEIPKDYGDLPFTARRPIKDWARKGGREGEICGGGGTVTMLLHHTSKWVCLRLAHGNTEDMENNWWLNFFIISKPCTISIQ